LKLLNTEFKILKIKTSMDLGLDLSALLGQTGLRMDRSTKRSLEQMEAASVGSMPDVDSGRHFNLLINWKNVHTH
jgi:hypothetical protein